MAGATSYMTHVTTEGERWDQIAWKYYADPFGYLRIIDANPQVLIMSAFPAGLVLSIPVIEAETTTEELPPWM